MLWAEESTEKLRAAAEDKLKATFNNLVIHSFGPSPIPGIYEIATGNNVIYFDPKSEIIIFGEMFSKEGVSLTRERISAIAVTKVRELPLDKAIKIGSGKKVIIEFTDPECPHCQRMHQFITRRDKEVTRYVFMSPITSLHPQAARKAVHVLCATHPERALAELFATPPVANKLQECAAGKERLAVHEEISKKFGVSGTPTLVLGNEVVTGFDQTKVTKFLTN